MAMPDMEPRPNAERMSGDLVVSAQQLITTARNRSEMGKGIPVGLGYEKTVVLQYFEEGQFQAVYKIVEGQITRQGQIYVPYGPQDRGLTIFGYKKNTDGELMRLPSLSLPRDPKFVNGETLGSLREFSLADVETLTHHLEVAKRVRLGEYPSSKRSRAEFNMPNRLIRHS